MLEIGARYICLKETHHFKRGEVFMVEPPTSRDSKKYIFNLYFFTMHPYRHTCDEAYPDEHGLYWQSDWDYSSVEKIEAGEPVNLEDWM